MFKTIKKSIIMQSLFFFSSSCSSSFFSCSSSFFSCSSSFSSSISYSFFTSFYSSSSSSSSSSTTTLRFCSVPHHSRVLYLSQLVSSFSGIYLIDYPLFLTPIGSQFMVPFYKFYIFHYLKIFPVFIVCSLIYFTLFSPFINCCN